MDDTKQHYLSTEKMYIRGYGLNNLQQGTQNVYSTTHFISDEQCQSPLMSFKPDTNTMFPHSHSLIRSLPYKHAHVHKHTFFKWCMRACVYNSGTSSMILLTKHLYVNTHT
jgi:hypothetical protein